jgi:hypothetical protein
MPIPAFDAAAQGAAVDVTVTFSHTCSGTDRVLYVRVNVNTNTITSIQYAGVDMTQILVDTTNAPGNTLYIYRLVAPATGANNVVINTTGSAAFLTAVSMSFSGVHQSAPNDSISTTTVGAGATSISTNVPSATGKLVADFVSFLDAVDVSVGGGQTRRVTDFAVTGGTYITTEGSTEPGASTVTMSWTHAGFTNGALQYCFSINPAVRRLTTLGIGNVFLFPVALLEKLRQRKNEIRKAA